GDLGAFISERALKTYVGGALGFLPVGIYYYLAQAPDREARNLWKREKDGFVAISAQIHEFSSHANQRANIGAPDIPGLYRDIQAIGSKFRELHPSRAFDDHQKYLLTESDLFAAQVEKDFKSARNRVLELEKKSAELDGE